MSNKPTIVGIGSASQKVLNHINKNEPNLKFLCIDNNSESLKDSDTRRGCEKSRGGNKIRGK